MNKFLKTWPRGWGTLQICNSKNIMFNEMESIISIYLYANKQESIIEANLRKGFKCE